MTRRTILKADAWPIFLTFLGAMLFNKIVSQENVILRIIAASVLCTSLIGWLLIVGINLNRNVPEVDQKDEKVFIFSGIYCSIIAIIAAIDPPFLKSADLYYVLIFGGLFGFCFLYVYYFCSTAFMNNQSKLNSKERLSPSIVFIAFIMFIIGIFLLQPRIKKMYEQD